MHKIFTNTIFIGKKIIYLPTCHSTNDIATEVISKKDNFEGTIIITDDQTKGKGQRGNVWEAEAGKNLTFSIILKPHFLDISEQFFLNIIISLSIYDLLAHYVNDGLTIKWPNDIYVYDNKIGGILIENVIKNNQLENVVVGIGLNINQIKFNTPGAVSLAMLCNQQFALKEILALLVENIEARYLQLKKGEKGKLLYDYQRRLYWINENHTFKAETYFEGSIIGIDETGRLMVRQGQNNRYFSNKEIVFVK